MKKFVLPTICVDEVKFCKEGKFFFLKYNDNGASALSCYQVKYLK